MAPSGQVTTTELEALLKDGSLTGNWTLDPARSSVTLNTKSIWGLAKVKGVFHDVTGEGTVNADGAATGTITVAAASIDTANKKRDTHLRSADFFDADNHPSFVFLVTGITPRDDGGVTVSGTLTVRGTTKPVTFDAAVTATGSGDAGTDNGTGTAEVTLDGALPINRGDFGLSFNQMGMMSLDNTLTIHAAFTKV